MKTKANTVETLKELLQNQKNKSEKLKNTVNQSYHEYQFYNLEYLKKDMLELLIQISENSSFQTPLFQNILKNINKSGTTLLSTGQEILKIIKDQQFITFSHKESYSQSLLFALILSKSHSIKVDIVGHQKSLKGIGHFIADQNQADRLGFTKDAAQKQGVTFHNLTEWNTHSWISKQSTIIIDIFALNPIEYRPFLLKYKTELKKAKKVIIYHSHLQDEQLISQLIEIKTTISDWFPLQLWNEHPLEYIIEKDQAEMFQRLFVFLKEDGLRSQKQDVVIFKPADINFRRFAGKLSEQLSKHHLKEQTNLITKIHQQQILAKNNIFIVQNSLQLTEWDYDYRNLFYVLDYQTEATFRYNYQLSVYVHSVGQCSGIQKAKRMTVVGSSRVGRYSCLVSSINTNIHYIDSACQLSTYIIRMITSNISHQLEFNRKRIKQCLKIMQHLGIIRNSQNKVQLIDERIAQTTQEGINPIQAKIIYNVLDDTNLTQQQKTRISNLLVMTFVVFHSQGNLRQAKQQIQTAAHIKPNGIWRKSGYLQSCLQILTKYDLIDTRKINQNSKSESFRRKTSKFNEFQYDVFGSLFQIVQAKKKSFQEMDQQQFLRENIVNQDLFLQIREEVFDFRDALGIEKTNIILEKQDWNKIIQILLKSNKHSMALYSGSRRRGYTINHELNSVFPDKSSLMSQLNQRPEFLLLIRLSQHENRYEILMSNSFLTELYIDITGTLPVRKSQSQSQIQIQFHGISNSTFQQLWKNNGSNIVKFQTQYNCYIQSNLQMAMIIIHSAKQSSQKIKAQFESTLTKIKQKMSVSNKMVHYLGNTNLLLGAGGSVKQIIKSNYIDKCLLNNLHLEVTKQDLEELFQQFFVLKKIEINEPQPGKFCKSATIHFNSQRDYYLFYDYFNECLFFDRLMDVKPIREERTSKFVKAKQYIEFKWFVWRSHLKALVKFATTEAAQKAIQAFKIQPKLDDSLVTVTIQGSSLFIQNLKPYTDQLFIQQAMKGYGQIKQVQILKTPLKQTMGNQIYLESLMKTAIQPNEPVLNLNYKMDPIQKCKNGLRICRVHIEDLNNMNKIANQLNKTIGKLGQGRLYAHTWFQTPIIVPHRSMPLYQQVMAQVFKQNQYPNIHSYIRQQNQKTYIMLKCNIKPLFDAFHQKLMGTFQGYPIDLSQYQKSIILTEIGLANLLDLQEKYHCKLLVNQMAKSLHVLVTQNKLKNIKQEIKARVEDHFFYRLSINSKTFKHLKNNPKILQEIKTNYTLRLVQLEIDSKALLLQGSAVNVQKAFNYLMHLVQSLTVPQQQMINADVCGICCCEPHRPYRLQKCSHKFCRACLLQYINSALGDNSLFPLKCPHCCLQIIIDDLQCLLQAGQWGKVQIMATNQFVTKNAQIMTFCFTAGCKQINMIKGDHIECDVCLSSYCIQCKMKYHPKMTCEQAKSGGDQLFKKYMLENGIRQCPNDKCKIPVVRIDGCYRVTCSRCNKSMCFKCDADKMKAYDDYNECYKHLNDVHGGYW